MCGRSFSDSETFTKDSSKVVSRCSLGGDCPVDEREVVDDGGGREA